MADWGIISTVGLRAVTPMSLDLPQLTHGDGRKCTSWIGRHVVGLADNE